MHNFRRIARWGAFVLFMVVLVPIIVSVVGEFFIELAREKGFYSDPSNRLDAAMTAFTTFVTQTWLLVAAGFFGGLVTGLWLDLILRGKQYRKAGVPVSKEALENARALIAARSSQDATALQRPMKEQHATDALEAKRKLRDAARNLDDLHAEGVANRNRLIPPLAGFENQAELAKLEDWDKRVLAVMDTGDVSPADRSRFRTLERLSLNQRGCVTRRHARSERGLQPYHGRRIRPPSERSPRRSPGFQRSGQTPGAVCASCGRRRRAATHRGNAPDRAC